MSLALIRELAKECGLYNLNNGYDENSFSYRASNNKYWFICVDNATVLIQLHQSLLIDGSLPYIRFLNKYSVDLYEPTSVDKLREIFQQLSGGLL